MVQVFDGPHESLRSQDTSMRIVLDGAEGLDFAMVSSDGEELCRGKLVETSEGQTLELESEEGTETWRKMPGFQLRDLPVFFFSEDFLG